VLGSVFGQYQRGGAWVRAQASYSSTSYDDITRNFMLGADFQTERANGHGNGMGLALGAGHWFQSSAVAAGEAAVAGIGWDVQGQFDLGGASHRPMASLAYAHNFRAERWNVSAGLTTLNGEFSMPGFAPDHDRGEAAVGDRRKGGRSAARLFGVSRPLW
jgi:outer membrane lipase/esterase